LFNSAASKRRVLRCAQDFGARLRRRAGASISTAHAPLRDKSVVKTSFVLRLCAGYSSSVARLASHRSSSD